MNATTRAAFYRFGIPRGGRSKYRTPREEPIAPTPETVDKRQFPVWNLPGKDKHDEPLAWDTELQLAAFRIDLAVRLLAGASLCQAQDLLHVSKAAKPVWSKAQSDAVERYRGWARTMEAVRWPVQPILDAVVHGREPVDVWLLRQALHLHATGRILGGLKKGA